MQREIVGPLCLRTVAAPLEGDAVLALGSEGCTTLPGNLDWDAYCTWSKGCASI